MKLTFTCLGFFLFLFITGYSQDTTNIYSSEKTYIPLNQFKKLGGKLTKKDSLNFRFYKNDTLVPISPDFFTSVANKKRVKVKYEPKDSTFLTLYKDVVFNKNSKNHKNKGTIKIWKEDVRLFFHSSVPKSHRKKLLNFAKKISSGIDSLNIYEVKDSSKMNYLVYYINDKDDFNYEPRINKRGGYYVNWNDKQQFYRAVLKINSQIISDEAEQLAALKYYFFRSLGYFHSSNLLKCKSYLSNCPEKRGLTKMDLKILDYHYSYGMCKGIGLEDFERIHKDYKAILKKDPDARLYVVHLQ